MAHAQAVVWSINVASLLPSEDLGKATCALTYQRLVFSEHPQISPYFASEVRVTLPNASPLRLVCNDAWSSHTEASVIRQAKLTPALQVSDLEAWYRERDMLIEVNDDDYQEPRLSVIG